MKVHSSPVSDHDFNKPIGMLTQTVYLPNEIIPHWALTGTTEGCVVIWETNRLYHARK